MIKRAIFIFFLHAVFLGIAQSQVFIHTSDLFPVKKTTEGAGELSIYQDPQVDTLMSRYILGNRMLNGGMEGFRIQIYRSSNRNAREESAKVRAEFMVEFPEITSYAEYDRPAYFLVRAGDFRTKLEAAKTLALVRKKYPNAYMVPCVISFPDLNIK
ncbi:MAG: SPOR domain-containing protein [Bacteroidales bacterium]